MAYAGVTSLYHSIVHLMKSSLISQDKTPQLHELSISSSSSFCCSADLFLYIRTYLSHHIHIFRSSSTDDILTSAMRAAYELKRSLGYYDVVKNSSGGAMAVEARIRDEARRLEDLIDSSVAAQFLSWYQSSAGAGPLPLDLNHLKFDVDLFISRSKQLGEEYVKELNKPPPSVAVVSVPVTVSSEADDMVGLSDLFIAIRHRLTAGWGEGRRFSSFMISGMAGSGKTTLMKKVFNDPSVEGTFERRAFVRVGQRYDFFEILAAIAAQLNAGSDGMAIGGAESVPDYFKRSLRGKGRFLIVLDDVWGNVRDAVSRQNLLEMVPNKGDCDGCVVITSRLQEVDIVRDVNHSYRMRFLAQEESWELLQREVFGEGGECPPPLVKVGNKIAENCEGLPLLIVSVGKLLSEAEHKTVEYWKEVAEMKNSVFEDAIDAIYELLLPSYHYLGQNYKACFLYIGAFPKNVVIRRSRIVNLWSAERFADEARFVVTKLVENNLLISIQTSETIMALLTDKACKVHVVFRYMAKREGGDVGFLHILSTYDGMIDDRLRGKRHLAVHHNSLLGMKEVQRSMASPSASDVRSVLCIGPYHQYQVPVACPEPKLLKVLDAATFRHYEFPVELVEQVLLRYLSLSTNASLPTSINKLRFLCFLILHQHSSIINVNGNDYDDDKSSSYLPVEIWDLKELEHLQIVGRNLPPPPLISPLLPNLKQLLDAGYKTYTKAVLDNIPNLEKLRIRIELEPHFNPRTVISCFQKLYCLTRLRSLHFEVINPVVLPKPAVPPRFLSYPIYTIRKLSLSGFGYPWADMSIISKIACLHVLKLKCYAFCGEEWEENPDMRFEVAYLLIDGTDLVHWRAAEESFPRLEKLIIKNCYKLRDIPSFKYASDIRLLDCNPLAEARAKQPVRCEYSWKS